MAFATPISASLSLSFSDVRAFSSAMAKAPAAIPRPPLSKCSPTGSSFSTGSPLLIRRTYCQKKPALKAMRPFSIRCEQSSKEANGTVDVWLGRLAMVGFAAAISVEIATGKGLLEIEMLLDLWDTLHKIQRVQLQLKIDSPELPALREFWAHISPAYSSLGSYRIGGRFNCDFYLPVCFKRLIAFQLGCFILLSFQFLKNLIDCVFLLLLCKLYAKASASF
ncbi:uncharacterized protein LOC122313890 [Carya illinoinensis]|uniref:uncharacterized protein LOC122313890 n=1 Tax=Carya illinoinensis TaxID=32201 RepID=UPI001C72953B|nr:uncharacterized protein LOC122313890 [Carya illinoinensis]